jgi:glycine oxidase ThiO
MRSRSEIVVIGGGIVGLAIALELRLRGLGVTVLSRDFKAAAAHAAAGMLAPQAEEIPPGAMLDLCLASRALYPKWVQKIEEISQITVNYWPCGILSPKYTAHPDRPDWLDRSAIDRLQSGLGEDVCGGYYYADDAQVDNRALIQALWQACQVVGVNYIDGVKVTEIVVNNGKVDYLKTDRENVYADRYCLAAGAWSQELLPIPVVPIKGQMLSVSVPVDRLDNLPLQQVLFGENSYIVPRRNGRIIIGATSENTGFKSDNTAAGVMQLLTNALRLFPQIANYSILETWWGFRPMNTDELPILGDSIYPNLTLATGHYRNGILLTPITAKLIGELIYNQTRSSLLLPFGWRD